LVGQGDLQGALTVFREGLYIRRRISAQEPGNGEWRRDISVSVNKIGDLLKAQSDPNGALMAYREALDIVRQLSANDPGNSEWRRDVSLSLERIGDVLRVLPAWS
jgi:hypothetical protein